MDCKCSGRPNLSASEAVSELISDLGLPKTLEEVGIKESHWDKIAEYGLIILQFSPTQSLLIKRMI